jgi:hypothetical protein
MDYFIIIKNDIGKNAHLNIKTSIIQNLDSIMDIIEDKGNSNKNKELVDNELTLDELTSYVKSIFAEGRDRHYENKSMV